jgi:hypothetical protein
MAASWIERTSARVGVTATAVALILPFRDSELSTPCADQVSDLLQVSSSVSPVKHKSSRICDNCRRYAGLWASSPV